MQKLRGTITDVQEECNMEKEKYVRPAILKDALELAPKMRKEDREFKTIFFIKGYHLYVTIPLRNKSSFMFIGGRKRI